MEIEIYKSETDSTIAEVIDLENFIPLFIESIEAGDFLKVFYQKGEIVCRTEWGDIITNILKEQYNSCSINLN